MPVRERGGDWMRGERSDAAQVIVVNEAPRFFLVG